MTRRSRRTHCAALGGLFLLAALLLPQAASAQLYSWKDAEGNVTIKNSPPPWYKQDEASRGPRVQVLREGKVVDDTGWSMARRLEGRAQAARQDEAVLPTQAQAAAAAAAAAAAKAGDGQPSTLPAAPRGLQANQEQDKQD